MTHEEEAQFSYRLFTAYRNDRQEWLEKRIKDAEFAMGQQWTEEESQDLKRNGQVDYVWNRIKPMLNYYESLLTSRIPEAQLIPTGDSDKELVPLISHIIKYILYISYWPLQFKRVMKSTTHKGLGWLWAYPDPFSSAGMGDLKVGYVNIQDVFVPKDASEIFFDDAEALILSRILPLVDAQRLYPSVKTPLERMAFSGRDDSEYEATLVGESEMGALGGPVRTETTGPQQASGVPEFKNVRILHRFTKERRKIWKVMNQWTGEILREEETEPVEEELSPDEMVAPFFETRIRIITSAGPQVYIGEEILPIEHWPLIPFVYEDTENPYPISAVTLLAGQQKLLNKFCSLILLNVQLSSALRWLLQEGSVDMADWQKNAALPGALLTYKQGYEKPQVVQISPVSGAMFAIAEDIKREISYESAAMPFHQGSSEKIPPTYSQSLMLREESVQRMGGMIQMVDMSIQRLYEVLLGLIPRVYNRYRLLSIIDFESGQPETMEINNPQRDQETGQILEILNDVTKFRARVMIRTGSSIEPSRIAYLNLFAQLSQQFPVFAKYMIKFMDFPGAKELARELDENAQLKQMVEAYGKNLEQMQEMLQSLEIEVRDRDRKVEIHKMRAALAPAIADYKAFLQTQQAIQRMKPQTEKGTV